MIEHEQDGPLGALRESGVARLSEASSPDQIEEALRKLANHVRACDSLRLSVVRDAAVKQLKAAGASSQARLVDDALKPPESQEDGSSNDDFILQNTDHAWPDPVGGAELLDQMSRTISRYVALTDGAAEATALWILYCYTFATQTISAAVGSGWETICAIRNKRRVAITVSQAPVQPLGLSFFIRSASPLV